MARESYGDQQVRLFTENLAQVLAGPTDAATFEKVQSYLQRCLVPHKQIKSMDGVDGFVHFDGGETSMINWKGMLQNTTKLANQLHATAEKQMPTHPDALPELFQLGALIDEMEQRAKGFYERTGDNAKKTRPHVRKVGASLENMAKTLNEQQHRQPLHARVAATLGQVLAGKRNLSLDQLTEATTFLNKSLTKNEDLGTGFVPLRLESPQIDFWQSFLQNTETQRVFLQTPLIAPRQQPYSQEEVEQIWTLREVFQEVLERIDTATQAQEHEETTDSIATKRDELKDRAKRIDADLQTAERNALISLYQEKSAAKDKAAASSSGSDQQQQNEGDHDPETVVHIERLSQLGAGRAVDREHIVETDEYLTDKLEPSVQRTLDQKSQQDLTDFFGQVLGKIRHLETSEPIHRIDQDAENPGAKNALRVGMNIIATKIAKQASAAHQTDRTTRQLVALAESLAETLEQEFKRQNAYRPSIGEKAGKLNRTTGEKLQDLAKAGAKLRGKWLRSRGNSPREQER